MKIASVTSFIARLPLTEPMKMGGLQLDAAVNLFVRLQTEDGIVGWGEAASAPTMTGETAPGMLAAARWLAPRLAGRSLADADALLAAADLSMVGNGSAKSAIEMAFLDALGRRRGVPLHNLLGTQRRSRVEASWILAAGRLDEDVAQSRARLREGWRSFKVKVGMEAPADDARRTLAVLQAVGRHARVCADANQGYTTAQAVEYLRALEGGGLQFFEQPIAGHDEGDWLQLADTTDIPLGIDESLHTLADAQRFASLGMAAGGSFKIIKLGGVSRVHAAARATAERGFRINLACKVAESSVATAAVLHTAAALPQIDWGVSLTNQYLERDVAARPITVTEGQATVPTGAGLGIEVDEAVLDSMRVADHALF